MSSHTLKEVGRPLAHPGVDEGLGGFDVVVEVVTERLDVRDDLCATLHCQMTREEDCCR
jgi:3-hydroxyacyl-CoA dehydrogenase